jgi:hypothetical protein
VDHQHDIQSLGRCDDLAMMAETISETGSKRSLDPLDDEETHGGWRAPSSDVAGDCEPDQHQAAESDGRSDPLA